MISLKKARQIVFDNVRPLKAAGLALSEALGCCLAGDVRADRDQPPTDRSAMDGYAVRAEDVSKAPRQLKLIGEVSAGSAARPRVKAGTCVRILTGAAVPAGADTVVKVEETAEDGDAVTFLEPATKGANIRKRGEEVRKGDVVLPCGTMLGHAQIGLCASVGKAVVRVHTPPSVVVLCTGNELRKTGETVRPHELRDSNGPALCAALNIAGYTQVTRRIVPDAPRVLAEALKSAAAEHDVVIVTGGVSVGKYDFVPEAMERIGAKVRFHGVKMKPGKPQLYATLTRNRHIFGLPGNPLSVIVGFHEIVLPAIRRLSGLPRESCRTALRLPLARSVTVKGGRVEFILARLTRDTAGTRVDPFKSHGSADLVAGARADGVFAVSPKPGKVPAGTVVEFTPWKAMC